MHTTEMQWADLHSKIRQSGLYDKYKGCTLTLSSKDFLDMAYDSKLDKTELQEWLDIWLSEFSYSERQMSD